MYPSTHLPAETLMRTERRRREAEDERTLKQAPPPKSAPRWWRLRKSAPRPVVSRPSTSEV